VAFGGCCDAADAADVPLLLLMLDAGCSISAGFLPLIDSCGDVRTTYSLVVMFVLVRTTVVVVVVNFSKLLTCMHGRFFQILFLAFLSTKNTVGNMICILDFIYCTTTSSTWSVLQK
jgi:hypothetical protein